MDDKVADNALEKTKRTVHNHGMEKQKPRPLLPSTFIQLFHVSFDPKLSMYGCVTIAQMQWVV